MIFVWKIKYKYEYKLIVKEIIKFLKPNSFLIFFGEIGVGKTFLIKLIAKKLGVKETVISPTFNIVCTYKLKKKINLNHFDLFRLKENEDIFSLFEELTFNNLNMIEWPEKNKKFWKDRAELFFISIVVERSGFRIIKFGNYCNTN